MADCKLIDAVESGMRLKNPVAQRRAEAIVDANPEKLVQILRETNVEGGTAFGAGEMSTFTPQHGAELGNNLVLQWGERQAQRAITVGDSLINRHVLGHSVKGSNQIFGKASVSPDSIQHNITMLIKQKKGVELGDALRELAEHNDKGWFDSIDKVTGNFSDASKKAMVGLHSMFKELGESINAARQKNGLSPIDLREGYIPTSVMGRYSLRGYTPEGRAVFLTAETPMDIEKQLKQLENQGISVVQREKVQMRKDERTFDALDRVLFPDVSSKAKANMIPSHNAITSMHVGGAIGAKYAVKNIDNNARRLANYLSSLELESKIKELGGMALSEDRLVKDAFSNEMAALANRSRRIGGFNYSRAVERIADAIDGSLERAAVNKFGATSIAGKITEGGLIKKVANASTKAMTTLKIAGNVVPQVAGSVFQPVLFGPTHVAYLADKYGMGVTEATTSLAKSMGEMLVSDKGATEYMNKMIDAGELFHTPVEIADSGKRLRKPALERGVDVLYHIISRGEDFNRVIAGYTTYKHLTKQGMSPDDAFASSVYDAAQYIPSSKRINKAPVAETLLGKQYAGSAMAMRGYLVHGWGTVVRTAAAAGGGKGKQAAALIMGTMIANGLAGMMPLALVDSIIKTSNENLGTEYPLLSEMIAADDDLGQWMNDITGESQLADNYTDGLKFGIVGALGYDISRAAAAPGPTMPIGLPPGLEWMYRLASKFTEMAKHGDPGATDAFMREALPSWGANVSMAVQQAREKTAEFQTKFGMPSGRSYDIADVPQMAGFDTTKNVRGSAEAKLVMKEKKGAKGRIDGYADTIARAIASGDNERAMAMLKKYAKELSDGTTRGLLMAQEDLASKVVQRVQRSKMTAKQADYSTPKGAIAREGQK